VAEIAGEDTMPTLPIADLLEVKVRQAPAANAMADFFLAGVNWQE